MEIANLAREELIADVIALRAGIRAHRESTGHSLCWHHPQLWSLLREPIPKDLAVPNWPQFVRVALSIGGHSTENFPTLHARM